MDVAARLRIVVPKVVVEEAGLGIAIVAWESEWKLSYFDCSRFADLRSARSMAGNTGKPRSPTINAQTKSLEPLTEGSDMRYT